MHMKVLKIIRRVKSIYKWFGSQPHNAFIKEIEPEGTARSDQHVDPNIELEAIQQ